eukprot:11164117-Alexandrium_andersonii.AAC.1
MRQRKRMLVQRHRARTAQHTPATDAAERWVRRAVLAARVEVDNYVDRVGDELAMVGALRARGVPRTRIQLDARLR